MPPFQVLFSLDDTVYLKCMDQPEGCGHFNYPPILSFASVQKDDRIAPSIQVFPHAYYAGCMIAWRRARAAAPQEKQRVCKTWPVPDDFSSAGSWSKLKPQVVWRGSNFHFLGDFEQFKGLQTINGALRSETNLSEHKVVEILLDETQLLRPRIRAVAMSLKAESDTSKVPWIDAKFVVKDLSNQQAMKDSGGEFSMTAKSMDRKEMAQYKYFVDIGGGSGTSWLSTIAVLAMPGLLFHHETTMKDWYYGEIQPWVHYVPVNIDLTDLHEKFEWAQSNPAQAEIIAKAGQDFAAGTLAENYIKTTHERFFREYLGEVVEAYRPLDSETPDYILRVYEADGLGVFEVAVCNKTYCAMPVEKDKPIAHVRLPCTHIRIV
jgi:hypothetical protein